MCLKGPRSFSTIQILCLQGTKGLSDSIRRHRYVFHAAFHEPSEMQLTAPEVLSILDNAFRRLFAAGLLYQVDMF